MSIRIIEISREIPPEGKKSAMPAEHGSGIWRAARENVAEPPAEKAEAENGRTREEQPPVELPAISEVIGAAQIPSIRQTLCETDKQENLQSDADDRES